MHIEANRQAYRYNLFVESADKYKFNYRRVSYGQNTLGNTTGRLFVHRRIIVPRGTLKSCTCTRNLKLFDRRRARPRGACTAS